MEILIYTSIVSVLLAFKLWWDWRAKNIKKRIINHKLSAAIDVLIYTVLAWFLFGWDSGGYILVALSFRWIMFDILFNIINKDSWDHYGESSMLDRFMTRLGKFHLIPKLVLMLAGIVLIIIV